MGIAPIPMLITTRSLCDFLPGKPNICELTGGTGKFRGLQASIVITSTLVKSTYEGTQQLVGHKNGTYKIVKTN
jgi:hypothetical protein